MSSHAFSSIVLRDLLKEAQRTRRSFVGEEWVEAMVTKYDRAIQEQPVVFLTEKENSQARKYVAWYKDHNWGWDVADQALSQIRDNHTAEIRKFIKQSGMIESDSTEDIHKLLPRDDGPPTCFKEWFAVNQVWRLTLVLPEISFQEATVGTPECCINRLPKLWEDGLDECMQTTDRKAIVPTRGGYGLRITRESLNSVLPTSDKDLDESGLLTNAITDPWFGILVEHSNQRKRNSTIFIQPDSLELVAATPQEVAENAAKVNKDLEVVLFPTIIKSDQRSLLVVAFPKRHFLAVYDSQGREATKALQKERPWIKRKDPDSKEGSWEVRWLECPQAGGPHGSGEFMFINALLVCLEKPTLDTYSQKDTLFLRRYIAAVICMKELPETILKD